MNQTPTPYHQVQITRSMPAWVRTLHPDHTRRIVQTVRKDYMDENGSPYSWYAAAAPEEQQLLKQCIGYRDTQVKALHAVLSKLKGISEFCKPLLEARLDLATDVEKAQYVHQPFEVVSPWINPPGFEFSPPPVQEPEPTTTRPVGAAQKRSLLEAALHNFEGLDEVGPYDALTQSTHTDEALRGLEPEGFVRLCRKLDLGQQYQDHLHAVYQGTNQAEIERLWIQANRQALKVQALIASLKGLLSRRGRDALVQLCNNERFPHYGEASLHCWRFSLFGIPIHDVLLIGPDQADQNNPCILFIPNDTEHPVREYPSLQAMGAHLRQRVLHSSFRQQLIGFAHKRQQPELSRRLESALFTVTDTGIRKPREASNIHWVKTPLASDPWPVLYQSHTKRLKQDARTIAVPTADADAKARAEQLQHWLDAGMNALNVAAFFIPGLDAVMLAVFAYDIMDSVFTGFAAWEDGDTHEALGQLQSLAINVAVLAGFAVGAKALKASGFVDALESVWHGDRQVLWHADMRGYASTKTLPEQLQPDPQGLYRTPTGTYLRLEGRLHEVFEDSQGQWRVRHPNAVNAYSPRLHHNGRGGWRLAHEQPLHWDDSQLMRRLTPNDNLADADLDAARRSSGIDARILRQVHLGNERPPAQLVELIQRLAVDDETLDIIHRVRQHKPLAAYKNYALPELLQLKGWPEDHVLKVYEGAEPFGAHTRLGGDWRPGQVEIEITLSDLENGELCQVIVDQLDSGVVHALMGDIPVSEQSSKLANLLGDQLQGKHHAIFDSLRASRRVPQSVHAQTLGRQFPGLPDAVLQDLLAATNPQEQQHLAMKRVPLRIGEQARIEQARARLDRALLGLYRKSLSTADSLTLEAALRAEYPAASLAQLFDIAVSDRARAAMLLGQRPIKPRFVSPSHLAGGGLGYHLSGRGMGIEERRLQRLYPALDPIERRNMLDDLRRHGNVGEQITALERQQQILDDHLRAWVAQATPEEQPSRNQLREVLNRVWRRDYVERFTLEHMHIPALPSLPVRLDHIIRLDIDAIGLQEIPEDFLRSFPRLQQLSIRNNSLLRTSSLFRALPDAHELGGLSLIDCGITELTFNERETLASLPALRALDLHDNPLQQLSGLERFTRLERLNLSDCQLYAWPDGLTALMENPHAALHNLDLSGNAITEVPELARVLASPFVAALERADNPARWCILRNPLASEPSLQLANRRVQVEFNLWLLDASDARRSIWDQLFVENAHPELQDIVERLAEVRAMDIDVDVWPLLELISDVRSRAIALHHPDLLPHLTQRLERVALEFANAESNALADALSTLQVEVSILSEVVTTPPHPGRMFNTMRGLYARESVNGCARIIHQGRVTTRAQLRQALDQDPNLNVAQLQLPWLDPLDDLPSDQVLGDDSDLEEIRLRLREELADLLGFPEPGPLQWFYTVAPLSGATIYNVEQRVFSLEADAIARRTWIAQHPDWQIYLRTHFAERFEALNERWVGVITYLEGLQHAAARADHGLPSEVLAGVIDLLGQVLATTPVDANGQLLPVTLNEGQYLEASNLIPARLQQEQAALNEQLTAEADPN
ncbi:leucine-rich repeat domain-containing protein [Pseudomonas putida]|uniref:leucine-rich repeat domain-containing protein n=1 Tax=Pseudomonas putida TaxID=303 RepID=UPI0015E175F0|nr:leucine-rich repeat domain-containing protein [Pseudomonas putida]